MAARRQPIDRVIDLAIGLPIVTAVAAGRSVPLVARAARQGLRRAASRRPRTEEELRPLPPQAAEVPPAVPVTFEAPNTGLPIEDYDHLAAKQVVDRLATLSRPELELVDAYERAHRHRRTVLGRIAQLQT